MIGLEMLDVAIGLALVFFVFSLALTAANEALETFLKARARNLEKGLLELLDDPDGQNFAKSFFDHPLIYPLYRGRFSVGAYTLPSYIPTRNFSLAVLDLVTGPKAADLANKPSAKVRDVVDLAVRTGGGDPARTRAELEAWYDSTMDRVSGWYKRRTQVVILVLALAVTVIGNVNTIAIFQALQVNPTLRNALVKQAERTVAAAPAQAATALPADEARSEPPASDPSRQTAQRGTAPSAASAQSDAMIAQFTRTGLPIGWTGAGWNDVRARWNAPGMGALEIAIGWLLTALAVTLGAPFWFDVLNRLMVIRSTVKPHEKSGEEASEDRQSPEAVAPAARRPATVALFTVAATRDGVVPISEMSPLEADLARDEHEDGCLCDHDIDPQDVTADEQLPQATGGVAAQR